MTCGGCLCIIAYKRNDPTRAPKGGNLLNEIEKIFDDLSTFDLELDFELPELDFELPELDFDIPELDLTMPEINFDDLPELDNVLL